MTLVPKPFAKLLRLRRAPNCISWKRVSRDSHGVMELIDLTSYWKVLVPRLTKTAAAANVKSILTI